MVNRFPYYWSRDPEPFNKKEWALLGAGVALGIFGFFTPAPLNGIFFTIGFISMNLSFCGLFVLMVDPIGGTRWKKTGRENLPKYFVIFSAAVLFILVTLCAIM